MRVRKSRLMAAAVVCVALLGGCRGIEIHRDPYYPKQGDAIKFTVKVREAGDMDNAMVWIGGQSYVINSATQTIMFPTCKYSTGEYYTQLEIKGEVKYDDGEVKTSGPTKLELTLGDGSLESSSRRYSLYVAHDNDDDAEDILVEAASEFVNEFDALPQDAYQWASPWNFTNPSSPDLVIFMGHGNHHTYFWGPGNGEWTDVSTTAFGNFAFCNNYADTDYLVFCSCQTLSMADNGGQLYHWYWLHGYSTRLERRPFQGVHVVAGFRTNFVITETCFIFCSDDGDDFMNAFAGNLDSGISLKNSWLWAIDDELDQGGGRNRGAVIYNDHYSLDDMYTAEKDDYIYGSSEYNNHFFIKYHE